ncbi:hypothetical protein GGR52DRAFT_570326 [Hypoxylon sp. FL1284]|nr:hypothetical protein GGR52DRAFT_570326 [Hypoxylon sp. FL1284]
MFVTLRCNKDGMSVENVPTSAEDGTRPRHSACNSCRVKKLKCSGDRNICSACAASKTKCTYSPSASQAIKARRESRRSGRGSSISSTRAQPLATASGDSETTPTTNVGSAARLPRQQPPPPPPIRAASPMVSALPTPSPTGTGTEAGTEAGDDLLLDAPEVAYDDEMFQNPSWTPGSLIHMSGILDGTSAVIPGDHEGYLSLGQQDVSVNGDATTEDFALAGGSAESDATPPWLLGIQMDETLAHEPQYASPRQPPQPLLDAEKNVAAAAATTACACLLDAIATLERLEVLGAQDVETSTTTVDGMLSLNKSAIATCNSMLDCPSCRCLSSHVMLLILISRGLVLQFERLQAVFSSSSSSSLLSPLSPAANDKSSWPGADDPCQRPYAAPGAERNTSLGTYSVDTSEEWKSMLHALAVIQGRSLRSFLERVRSATSYRSWAAHQSILEVIEPRHRSAMISLQQLNSCLM